MTRRRVILKRMGLACACGLLWGAAVTAMETLSQPTESLPVQDLLALIGSIAWTWVLSGLWWALIALPLANVGARRLALLIPPLALAIALIHRGTWMIGLTFSLQGGSRELMGATPQPAAIFLHVLWANLFYGGLYLLGFAGYQRVWRSQRLLAELALSRAEVEAMQQEERLRTLRGQLQPGILVHALDALKTSYNSAPAHANDVFDELVRFLRAAMPAVRERRATLRSELTLLQHYAELRRRIGIGGGAVGCEAGGSAVEVPFPPLCLLPLMEALACDASQGSLAIRITGGADWTGVRLEAPCGSQPLPDSVGAEAERTMRLELAALYGSAADFVICRRPLSTSVDFRIPIAVAAARAGRPVIEEAL